MPFLALAIPMSRAGAMAYDADAGTAPPEVLVDLRRIENRVHAMPSPSRVPTTISPRRTTSTSPGMTPTPTIPMATSIPILSSAPSLTPEATVAPTLPSTPPSTTAATTAPSTAPTPLDRFRKTVYRCQAVPVSDYFERALATLVTPVGACAAEDRASNAELRAMLRDILALHPNAAELDVDGYLRTLGLASLLRDEPEFRPGGFRALCHDMGLRSVAFGRFAFPDLDAPGDAELLFAGQSELAFLHEGNPCAARIRRDHAPVLAFHYRAAGMEGHTALPPIGLSLTDVDDTTLSDFTAQLVRCGARGEPQRARRAVRPGRLDAAIDPMQTGPCTLL